MNAQVARRIKAPGRKRILACDGGGILGMMSVEILARMEADFRAAAKKPDLVLADVFDLVAGTSTGAIIAACIAAGMDTATLRRFYEESGPLMFEPSFILKRLRHNFTDEPLARMLRRELNLALGLEPEGPPAKLGNENLRTALMMVMRNHSTDSPWPVSNNPFAHYNRTDRADCNLELPLWRLVRASTAAPTFFPPETIVFAEGTPHEYQFVFVDGGVTSYNNPAFLAFQMATAKPYAMEWKVGASEILLVSVGTGFAPRARPGLQAGDLWLLDHARNIPSALMNGASEGWDRTCRILGRTRHGAMIDREFGDGMSPLPGRPAWTGDCWTGPQLFTYLRYDPDVTAAGLAALGLPAIRPEDVQVVDSVAHVAEIQAVGRAYAAAQLRPEHYVDFL
jgi:predicted acylesterase/phospholipase RssA